MDSVSDMTVTVDMSQLDQLVRVTCFADCENQEKETATCNLKRVFMARNGGCMRYTKRTGEQSELKQMLTWMNERG